MNEIGRNEDNLRKLSRECFGVKPKQTFLLSSYSFIRGGDGRRMWGRGKVENEGVGGVGEREDVVEENLFPR